MEHSLRVEFLLRTMVIASIGLIVAASQIFWLRRVRELGRKLLPSTPWRVGLGWGAALIYLGLFAYNFLWARLEPTPTRLTLRAALVEAPFTWWVVSSLLGFALAAVLSSAYRLARAASWAWSRLSRRHSGAQTSDPRSLSRRQFLEQAGVAVCAVPFAASAYGLFYERVNLEIANRRIRLPRCPKAFQGFRIAQLSDIHIGPFMSADVIRKYVALTSKLKPDLIVLTGDYVTWDPKTQGAAVEALVGLKAPHGIFGCLGNHELWTGTEASITRLFAARGIRILRQERAAIRAGGETLNLIGVDYETRTRFGPRGERSVRAYLEGLEPLVMPDTANILLSHNPNTFDRAAELSIDLSLAGHTHGGQVTLEFIHPSLSPSRLVTNYVKGWFEKPGGQLYVNRGIGTIGVPIRLGAPPEITVFELARS